MLRQCYKRTYLMLQMYTLKKSYWINDKGVVMSDDYLYTYVMQDHDEHFTAVYDKSSVKQIATDNFNVLSDRIMFKDDNTHTIYIFIKWR